jgi:4-hydroxybenzoate polyprenyltransferase
MNKWLIYQKERFPVLAHGVLILAFSASAVGYSHGLRGAEGWPYWAAYVAAFVNSFLSFLQLRIADEFKDFEEDSRYRPYRAVPRGLVTLRELGILGLITGVIQVVTALVFEPRLIFLLIVNWLYFAGMSKEFFAREWLKARPVIYLVSHMLMMPLIDFYATAADWLPAEGKAPHGLEWFVAMSFTNGVLIELARKIRAKPDEETGVETYSALWGIRGATQAWLLVFTATWFLSIKALEPVGGQAARVWGVLGAVLLVAAVVVAVAFPRKPVRGRAKAFELLTALWTLALYVSLGVVPLFLRN